MKQYTLDDIRKLKPCSDPGMYAPENWTGTLVDILKAEAVPVQDRIWVATQLLDDRTNRLFAVWCAREALKLVENPDPRSVAACDTAERFANGLATQEELDTAAGAARAASEAAWAASDDAWAASIAAWAASVAASDAAWAASRAAARDAAWDAARAASEAASDAAWAASRAAARDAAWDAARAASEAASDAAGAAQVQQLIGMIENNEKGGN